MESSNQNPPKKTVKHVCLTNRMPLGISSDPESDIIAAMNDPDVMTLIRGMTERELVAPFTGGAFGLDEAAVNAAVRKMKSGGLICSRRVEYEDGVHHHYYLNAGRFRTLAEFLTKIVDDAETMKASFPQTE